MNPIDSDPVQQHSGRWSFPRPSFLEFSSREKSEIFRQRFTGNDLVKHSTIGNAIAVTSLHCKTNNPSRKLIDDKHHPVRFQGCGFTSKEADWTAPRDHKLSAWFQKFDWRDEVVG